MGRSDPHPARLSELRLILRSRRHRRERVWNSPEQLLRRPAAGVKLRKREVWTYSILLSENDSHRTSDHLSQKCQNAHVDARCCPSVVEEKAEKATETGRVASENDLL